MVSTSRGEDSVILRFPINQENGVLVTIDPRRMCELMLGLGPNVRVSSVFKMLYDRLQIRIESSGERPSCPMCDGTVESKGRYNTALTDLTCSVNRSS